MKRFVKNYCLYINKYIIASFQATAIISKALTNKNYDSLQGLVTEDMIEILRAKIETLSPNQRQLIAVDEADMLFYMLSDIDATVGRNYLLN